MYLHPGKWADDPGMQSALRANAEIWVGKLFDIVGIVDSELASHGGPWL
jgi:hypothetical protein